MPVYGGGWCAVDVCARDGGWVLCLCVVYSVVGGGSDVIDTGGGLLLKLLK